MVVLVASICTNLHLEFPAPVLINEHLGIGLLLSLLVVPKSLLHLLVLVSYFSGLVYELPYLRGVILVVAYFVQCFSLLVLDLVQRIRLGLQLVKPPLGVFELGLELVELLEANSMHLGVHVLRLGQLDLRTQGFQSGVQGLQLFFLHCILCLLEMQQTKILFIPRYLKQFMNYSLYL